MTGMSKRRRTRKSGIVDDYFHDDAKREDSFGEEDLIRNRTESQGLLRIVFTGVFTRVTIYSEEETGNRSGIDVFSSVSLLD